jgi:hypothetical protein
LELTTKKEAAMALTQNRVEAPASNPTTEPSGPAPATIEQPPGKWLCFLGPLGKRAAISQAKLAGVDPEPYRRLANRITAVVLGIFVAGIALMMIGTIRAMDEIAEMPDTPATASEEKPQLESPAPEDEPFDPAADLGPLFVDSVAKRGDCRSAGFTFNPNSDQFQVVQEGFISDQLGNQVDQNTDPASLTMGTQLSSTYRIVATQQLMTVTVEKTRSGWRTYSCVVE